MAVICEIGAYIVIIILIYLVIYGRMNRKANSILLGGFDDGSDFERYACPGVFEMFGISEIFESRIKVIISFFKMFIMTGIFYSVYSDGRSKENFV